MKILLAKINPCPKVVLSSNNLFEEPTIIECDYMLALARPYVLGGEETNFEVQFGVLESIPNVNDPNAEMVETFIQHKVSQVKLTKDELSNWGENDEICLNLIAQKLNTTCVSFKELEV